MIKNSWKYLKKALFNQNHGKNGNGGIYSTISKVYKLAFDLKPLNVVMRIAHTVRWTWSLYLIVVLLIMVSANHFDALILFGILFNGLFWPPITNIFVKRAKDPLFTGRVILSLEICFAFFWTGVMQCSLVPSFVLISILLINYSCYCPIRKLLSYTPLMAVFLFLGLWTQDFKLNLIYPIHYDVFILMLFVTYLILVTIISKDFFTKILSLQGKNEKLFKGYEIFSGNFRKNYLSMNLNILFENAKTTLDATMGITSILYYTQSVGERFVLSEGVFKDLPKNTFDKLQEECFFYGDRHDIFSKTYQKDRLYFQYFDQEEDKSSPFYPVTTIVSSRFLILYPIMQEKKWTGLIIFAANESDLMRAELKLNILNRVAASLAFAVSNKSLFYEEEALVLRKRNINTERSAAIKASSSYLPDISIFEMENMLFSKDMESSRKRVLSLIVDLHSLIHLSIRENQYGKQFYEFIFTQFQKICHNHHGQISILSADRLSAYWHEVEGGFKDASLHALSCIKEFRETYNDYVKKEFLSHRGSLFLRFGLSLHYVTFACFGGTKHVEYNFYSYENDRLLIKLRSANPNAILCDEPTQLMLKNDVQFTARDETSDEFFNVLNDDASQKFENVSRRHYFAKKEKKFGFWKILFDKFNIELPQRKTGESLFKTIFNYLFTVHTTDPATNVTQHFRWMATPPILIMGAMLYYQGNLSIPVAILLLLHGFIWPIITNIWVKSCANAARQEKRIVLIESAWMGLWIGLLGLPIIPFLLVYICFLANNVLMTGYRILPYFHLYFFLLLLCGFAYIGFQLDGHSPMFLNYLMLFNFILYMGVLVFASGYISKAVKRILYLTQVNVDELSIVSTKIKDTTNGGPFSEKIETIGQFLQDNFNINNVMFYEPGEESSYWLKAMYPSNILSQTAEAMKKIPLLTTGEKSIFNGTYQEGGLYFYLVDNESKYPNHCLNDVHFHLQQELYILFPLVKKGELVVLLVFASHDVSFIKKKVKSLDLEYLGYLLMLALDKMHYSSEIKKIAERQEAIKSNFKYIKENFSHYLPASAVQRIMEESVEHTTDFERLRVITVYMDFTPLLHIKGIPGDALSMLYHGLFKSVMSFAMEKKGEIELLLADSAVVCWHESKDISFKELAKNTLLRIKQFREMYRELLESLKLIDDHSSLPLRISIRTHYVTEGFFGNKNHMEYMQVGQAGEALTHCLLNSPEGVLICDESIYLLTNDSMRLENITSSTEEGNKFFLVMFDQGDDVLLRKAKEVFVPVVPESKDSNILKNLMSTFLKKKGRSK